MKSCPSCGADVPAVATRCKECFHDFSEVKRKKTGPIVLLAAFAAMAVIGAGTFYFITQQPIEQRILVDEETQSVVFTTQFRSGPVTERMMWSEIGKLEHIIAPNGTFEVIAIRLDGSRKVIQESHDKPLTNIAEHYSTLMDKPLEMIDNTAGFGKVDQ